MSVTESETTDEAIEISLADVGCEVPPSVTCSVTIRSVGPSHQVLEIERRDDVWILEGAGVAELTGVIGYETLPERVPDWIQPVAEWFGVSEVQLGR